MTNAAANILHLPIPARRRTARRLCIVDAKPHIRKFLAETFEELGFVAQEHPDLLAFGAALDGDAPELVVLGLSAGGEEAAAILATLSARAFGGQVLLFGENESALVQVVQEFGEQIGLAMLPVLPTPFDRATLQKVIAPLLPANRVPRRKTAAAVLVAFR